MAFDGGQFGPSKRTLNRRFANTFLLLLLFRILTAIPALNVDEERLRQLLAANPLLGTVDLFAGGETLNHFSIAAAGIFPYLVALILVQVASSMSSSLQRMQLQGGSGKDRVDLITKLLTVVLAFFFAWGLSHYLSQQVGLFPGQIHWFTKSSFGSSLWIVCLVTFGSYLSTEVSNMITRKGIGSGAEIVLLGGSSLVFLKQMAHVLRSAPGTAAALERLGWIVVIGLVIIILSVYVMDAERDVPIMYPARSPKAGRIMQRTRPHLPLLLNAGRILPVSAGIGLLSLVQLSQGFFQQHAQSWIGKGGLLLTKWVTPASGWYWIALACLIVLFTYIYNYSILWQGDQPIAQNLKVGGAYVPGLRPGLRTQEYLTRIIRSISLPGGLSLAFLAAGVPYLVMRFTHQNQMVTILSLVVVVLTAQSLRDEVKAYHITESYQGFLDPKRKRRLLDRLL